MKFFCKNILYILLTYVFIISCNDNNALNYNKEIKEIDCSQNVKKECILGKWKIDTVIINNKEQNITTAQKEQYIEFTKNNRISTKMYLVRDDEPFLKKNNPIIISKLNYHFIDEEPYKKLIFQQKNINIKLYIKNIKNNKITLSTSGRLLSNNKNYILETIWNKI